MRKEKLRGYMGKILWVDLSRGEIKEEALDEKLCRGYIGGYGIGARMLFTHQKSRVNPLGPENILGFVTGPLTGVPGVFGTRFMTVAKSPLTGTWGDANCGGEFGPFLKFAGYDGLFFTGVAAKPTYLVVSDKNAELRDATHLWGKDTAQTEECLKFEVGDDARVVSIGPAGENLSLISGIMHHNRAAARSGLGAVMGSKKLKAVVATGRQRVLVADGERLKLLTKKFNFEVPLADVLRRFGTAGLNAVHALRGESPSKNWGGLSTIDFPNVTAISDQNVLDLQEKRTSCWRCSIACGGLMKPGVRYEYSGASRPEYETLCSFGNMCLNDDLESIIKANDICNRYGLDTISTGSTIAFAIECYENGIITNDDTEGIELRWGNHPAIVAITEKLAKRQGFGDILADGVRVAAEKIGKGAEEYAIHVHGQEVPYHDPRYAPSFGCSYQSDATPGRHNQGGLAPIESGLVPPGLKVPPLDVSIYTGKGKYEAAFRNLNHIFNVSGMCFFGSMILNAGSLPSLLSCVTGWQPSQKELDIIGQRVSAIRQAFNVREGLGPKDFKLPSRTIHGQVRGKSEADATIDVDMLCTEYYQAMDWDPYTGKPSKKKLIELDLEDIATELWP